MKKEEKVSLLSKKFKEGKPEKQCYKEIKDLDSSKIVFRKNKSEINKLKKCVDDLIEKNDRLKKEIFNKSHKITLLTEEIVKLKKQIGESKIKPFEDRLLIRRTIKALKLENEPIGITELSKSIGFCNETTYKAIGFLENNNIIKSFKQKGNIKYLL